MLLEDRLVPSEGFCPSGGTSPAPHWRSLCKPPLPPTECPAPQTCTPPPLCKPPLLLLLSHHSGTAPDPGERRTKPTRALHGGSPAACPPVPGPCPLLAPQPPQCRSLRKAALPSERARREQAGSEKAAPAPLNPHLHLLPAPREGWGSLPPPQSCPQLPGPRHFQEAPLERGAGAAGRGGGL